MKKILLIIALILFAFAANAQPLNAKTFDYVKLKIVQSGTLAVNGNVEMANLSYYIPQEGVLGVAVTADGDMSWRYTDDQLGNRLILLEWKKPKGLISYNIQITVENNAKHLFSDKQVGTNDFYLQQTSQIVIDDNIRQFAFPYEKSMKRAAELTKNVYDYVAYDLSYIGKNVPSNQVLAGRRGVCVEHANLLAALLRANEMPTRYAVGYAYSAVQNKFIGHTWVEVLASDGSWVPFDSTWLEAGYIDATHIKSAALLDNSQIDTLTYLGGGIDWTRNDEEISMLDYRQKDVTLISVSGTTSLAPENYGYIKAVISANECALSDLTAASCVDDNKVKQLNIEETNRSVWICGQSEIYWFFKPTGNNYICPVSVYDQIGGNANYQVTVSGTARTTALSISGPDVVGTGEQFTLTASKSGIFYSPEFGLQSGTSWTLSAKNPDIYKFYLYSDGNLYVKSVTVVQKREFDLSVSAPTAAKLGTQFNVSITINSLLKSEPASIIIAYTNQTVRSSAYLEKGAAKTFSFTLSANKAGLNDLIVSVTGNSLASHTVLVNTPEEKGFLDGIIKAISDFFAGIVNAIGSLFQ